MVGIPIFIFIAYTLGFSILRIFFKKTNWLEKVIIPQLFGLILVPFLFFILNYFFGYNSALLILPLLSLALCLISLRLPQKTIKNDIKPYFILLIIFLIAITSFALLSRVDYSTMTDITYHIAIAQEIDNSKVLPPQHPCVYDSKVNYPWFYHLSLAITSNYSKLSVFDVVPFFTIYVQLLFAFSVFVLGFEFFKKSQFATLFMFAIFLFYIESFFVAVSPQNYALTMMSLFFIVFIRFLKERSNSMAMLSGFVASTMIYFHGFSFVFILLCVASYVLFKLIDFKQFIKKDLKQVIYLLLPFAISLPYYLFVRKTASIIFIFEPFAGLLVFYFLKYFHIFFIIILPLVIYKAFKRKDEIKIILFCIILSSFVFVNTFLFKHGADIGRFAHYTVFPMFLLSISFIQTLKRKFKNITLIIFIILFAIPLIDVVNVFARPQNFFSTEKYIVSKWIGDNTPIDQNILTAPSSIYVGVSNRKNILCEPFMAWAHLTEASLIKSKFEELINAYTNPSQQLYKKYNISYVVVGEEEKEFFDKYDLKSYNFSSFEMLFSYENSTVYKVDYSKLPETVKAEELNYTYYSRWWALEA